MLLKVHCSWVFLRQMWGDTLPAACDWLWAGLSDLTSWLPLVRGATFGLRMFCACCCVTWALWCSEEHRDRQKNISYLWQYVCTWKEGESFTIHIPQHTPDWRHLGENRKSKVHHCTQITRLSNSIIACFLLKKKNSDK